MPLREAQLVSDSQPLPIEIDPDETLLRSVRKGDVNRSTMFIKAGALKPVKSDPYSISLIRSQIGALESKQAAINEVHGADFWGFGVAVAHTLAPHSRNLADDRATFFGHANLEIDYDIPPGPPNTPPDMDDAYEMAMSRLIALAKQFPVVEDEGHTADEWGGETLQAEPRQGAPEVGAHQR